MSRAALERFRYALAVGFLVLWAAAYARDGVWYGDSWSHVAVTRELAAHPFAPHHPQLLVDAPHPFFSPYAWLLGLVSRLTGASALATLAGAGVVNALLLGLATLALCRTLFARRAMSVSFWSLILIVFWWGDSEWFWSGFVHSGVFGYVASYPSTFALIASLFALSLTPGWLEGSKAKGAGVLALLTGVLLAHPLTAVFALVGMAALAFEGLPALRWRAIQVPLMALAAVAIASQWPLYPFLQLFTAGSAEFHDLSRDLYANLWTRTYPLVLGLPVVLARVRRGRRDPIVWAIAGLLIVYGAGFLLRWYGLGRVVSPLAILIQIGLAGELARLEEHLASPRARVAYAISLGLVVWVAAKADGPLGDIFHRRANDYAATQEMVDGIDDGQAVLADLATGWQVPAFGPKVVATDRPLYWVDDHPQRRADVARFFARGTSDRERAAIVDRYEVSYVLVEASNATIDARWLRLVRENASLRLLEVERPLAP